MMSVRVNKELNKIENTAMQPVKTSLGLLYWLMIARPP